MRRCRGAVDQNNLEPTPLVSILDELEDWARYLNAEPEVIHKLQAFEDAARGVGSEAKKPSEHPNLRRGPSL